MTQGVPSTAINSNSRPDARQVNPANGKGAATPASSVHESDGGVPTVTDDQTPPERYYTPPSLKGKGSPVGLLGADPITAYILQQSGTDTTIATNVFNRDFAIGGDGGSFAIGPGTPESRQQGVLDTGAQLGLTKDKKKGVSFLSRIMGGGKKKAMRQGALNDGENIDNDSRTEGMDAHVFSQPIGYIPRYPPPPKYIRVRSHHKVRQDFNNLFLAQELYCEPIHEAGPGNARNPVVGNRTSFAIPTKSGAIWAMQFSKDGKYLAAGGQEKIVRIWQVIETTEERSMHEKQQDALGQEPEGLDTRRTGVKLTAPVFRNEPIREYKGHTADILDLSWSKNQFLLSSSMDKTHSDFVTSIVFHPIDDRFFLAGSLDSKFRLWSIPDKCVAFWNEVPDLITAVAFTPDGRIAIAGCLSGLCLFYETEGLKYNTQLQVRSTLGKNAKGSKITGIETSYFPPEDPNGEVKILVTSNDSRVRVYNFRDKSLDIKFKGYENTCSQIHATFSDDGKYIISGSEDRRVYIWNVGPEEGERHKKRPVEYFEAHSDIVTVAILAPTKTRLLLGASHDPIYELCNPPPVVLVSKSQEEKLDKDGTTPPSLGTFSLPKVPEEPLSRATLVRALHSDGNIIVTADYTGRIKIFRQDCAYLKRKNDQWETGSTFSKKLGVYCRDSLIQGNTGWRNSIASDVSSGSLRSLRERAGSLFVDDSSRKGSVSPTKSMGPTSLSLGGSPRGSRSRAHSLTSNRGSVIVNTGSGSVKRESQPGSVASSIAGEDVVKISGVLMGDNGEYHMVPKGGSGGPADTVNGGYTSVSEGEGRVCCHEYGGATRKGLQDAKFDKQ